MLNPFIKHFKTWCWIISHRVFRLATGFSDSQLMARELMLPGVLMIGLVCLLRFGGLLQTQEWMLLDGFSRQCSEQGLVRRVTLITVDEDDYQTTGFPISADVLAQALTTLQSYQPRVIGLDIFRDLPLGQGEDMLRKVLSATSNVVVAEVSLSEEPMMNVAAPAGASPERVGFADSVVDEDGKVRRIVLSTESAGNRKESLALMLARAYLSADNVEIDETMLPRFYAYSGGYTRANTTRKSAARENTVGKASERQMLMNFCLLQKPDEIVSLRAVLQGRVDAKKIRDRIVLIGKASTSPKDSFITSAVRQTLYSRQVSGQVSGQNNNELRNRLRKTKIIYGVEVHGHATEQIIDFALGNRSALASWSECKEYIWMVAWGLGGMWISVRLQSPLKSAVMLMVFTLFLGWVGYYLLTQSFWLPVVPAVLTLWSAGLITAFFDRDIRSELVQRRAAIDRTYESVHNGPLQRLAEISRELKRATDLSAELPTELPTDQLLNQLYQLNEDMRNIFERLRLDTFTREDSLYLSDTAVLNLKDSLSDLLYQVYEHTLSQSLPGFEKIRIFITPVFEVLEGARFSGEEKRGLCLFLQEALSNVGKHAMGATRLDVVCKVDQTRCRLQIIDDGVGFRRRGVDQQGTRQARAIARRLKGKFYRTARQPNGTFCELSWPIRFW